MRTYKKKGEAMAVSETAVKKALEEVVKGLKSIREAAKSHGITKTTLGRRLKKLREQTKDKNAPDVLLHSGLKLLPTMNTKHSSRQIFTVAQERLLTEYLIKCSKLSYGLRKNKKERIRWSNSEGWRLDTQNNWGSLFLRLGRRIKQQDVNGLRAF